VGETHGKQCNCSFRPEGVEFKEFLKSIQIKKSENAYIIFNINILQVFLKN